MDQTPDIDALKAELMQARRTILGRQGRVKDFLDRLADRPPQALLLEGGREGERETLALYWAARLNCDRLRAPARPGPAQTSLFGAPAPVANSAGSPAGPSPSQPGGQPAGRPADESSRQPSDVRSACLECVSCRQVFARAHPDLLWLDGREDYIKIEPVRELRVKVGQPPRGEGVRVVTFMEAQRLTQEAANALLKSMEEPRPGNCFLLLAPQRETLLPTLVSRSFILTLAWPRRDDEAVRLPRLPATDEPAAKKKSAKDAERAEERDEAELRREWAEALRRFLQTGQGWFARTSQKGAVDRRLASLVLLDLQRALVEVLAGQPSSDLAAYIAQAGGPAYWRKLDRVAENGLDALEAQVNPALVLDWAATQGYFRS